MANDIGQVIDIEPNRFAGLGGIFQNFLVERQLSQQQAALQEFAKQQGIPNLPPGLPPQLLQGIIGQAIQRQNQPGFTLGPGQGRFTATGQPIVQAPAAPPSLRPIATGEVTSVFDPTTGQITPTQFPSPRVPSTTINLAPSEREAIASNLATDDALDNLLSLVDAKFIGPIEGRVGAVKDIFGFNTPQESEFRAATSTFRNQVIKEITGAQMSEKEATRILKQVPQENDPPSVWRAKWIQSKKNLERIRVRRAEVQRRARVTQQRTQQTQAGRTITATNPQTGERVQSVDGGQTWQPIQ